MEKLKETSNDVKIKFVKYIDFSVCKFSRTVQLKNEDIDIYDFEKDSETLAYEKSWLTFCYRSCSEITELLAG